MASLKNVTSTARSKLSASIDPHMQGEGVISVSPDMIAMGSLIGNMKATVLALGETLDVIEKQQEKVAQVVPALKASKQIAGLQERLAIQIATHREAIEQLQVILRQRAIDDIRGNLLKDIASYIDRAVAERVPEKATRLLIEKFPADLQAQGKTHKRQILEVQTDLHNSEARRLNSCIKSTNEAFQSLWRPPTSLEGDLKSPNSASSPKSSVTAPKTPDKFPTNLRTLRSLSEKELMMVLEENGVEIPKSAGDGTLSRGTLMNLFMAYSGIPFRVLPETQPSAQGLVVRW